MAEIPTVARSTPLDDLPELLTVDEFARWSGVSKGCVYEAVRRKTVPVITLGRLIRIPRSRLSAWLEGRLEVKGE